MTKFLLKFKTPIFSLFLAHFLSFWGKKRFSKNSSSVTSNYVRVSSTMPKLEEI